MKQKIGFLYLKTGGGHISGAKALIGQLEKKYGDEVVCALSNGFKENNKISTLFFEKGYAVTSNYFELGYVAFYQITRYPYCVQKLVDILRPFIVKNVVAFLRDEKITKVVCVHEVLIPAARFAINRVNPDIPLITLVMDPFTAHPVWFFEKGTELIVFSQKLRREAIRDYGFSPDRVHHFPLMLSNKFDKRYTEQEKIAAKEKHDIPLDKKIVLIAGGGEGLKLTFSIVSSFIFRRCTPYLIIVCGKNKVLKTQLELLVKAKQSRNIRIYGFVSFMPDLMNIADCVITKGGPATVMETLAVGKPLILASYIRGQELGNMLYVVQNKLGWYIPQPKKIIQKVEEIMKDETILETVQARIDAMGIRNGLSAIADFIYRFKYDRNCSDS